MKKIILVSVLVLMVALTSCVPSNEQVKAELPPELAPFRKDTSKEVIDAIELELIKFDASLAQAAEALSIPPTEYLDATFTLNGTSLASTAIDGLWIVESNDIEFATTLNGSVLKRKPTDEDMKDVTQSVENASDYVEANTSWRLGTTLAKVYYERIIGKATQLVPAYDNPFFKSVNGIAVTIQNKSSEKLSINWNESVFVDTTNASNPILNADEASTEQLRTNTVIIPSTTATEFLRNDTSPQSNMFTMEGLRSGGESVSLYMEIEKEEEILQLVITFTTKATNFDGY